MKHIIFFLLAIIALPAFAQHPVRDSINVGTTWYGCYIDSVRYYEASTLTYETRYDSLWYDAHQRDVIVTGIATARDTLVVKELHTYLTGPGKLIDTVWVPVSIVDLKMDSVKTHVDLLTSATDFSGTTVYLARFRIPTVGIFRIERFAGADAVSRTHTIYYDMLTERK